MEDVAELVRTAHRRAVAGDIGAYEDLLAPEATWLSVQPEPGEERPACHNRAEIIETLLRNGLAVPGSELEEVVSGSRTAAVTVRFQLRDGSTGRWFHTVEVANGRIVRMEDAESRADALRLAGLSDEPVA